MTIADVTPDLPVIPASRLVLRPLRKSDAGLIALYAGDARVASMTPSIPHPYPPGAAEAFIARAAGPDRKADIWAMDGSAQGSGELLGLVSLAHLGDDRSEIGFWVAPAFWNAGFASEAVEALMAANPQKAKTVFASVFQSNPHSARLLVNSGFDYIGDAESFSVAQNRVVPTWTYLRKLG